MKIREFKEALKKETDTLVPDVLNKVKQTPINALLTAKSPSQQLRRKLMLRLILPTVSLFFCVVLIITAFALSRPEETVEEKSYTFVTLEIVIDDTVSLYDLIVGYDDDIRLAVERGEYKLAANIKGSLLASGIEKLYDTQGFESALVDNSSIKVRAINRDEKVASRVSGVIMDKVLACIENLEINVEVTKGAISKEELYVAVKEMNQSAEPEMSVRQLIELYELSVTAN